MNSGLSNLPFGCRLSDIDGPEEVICPNCHCLIPQCVAEDNGGLCDDCAEKADNEEEQ